MDYNLDIKKCIRVSTIYGTGVIHALERWPRIGRQAGESYWYRTYGVKLDVVHKNAFMDLPDGIGMMHRDEIDVIDMVDGRITPFNVSKTL